MLAARFGLGNAMADTGLASKITHQLVRFCSPAGDVGVLVGVLVSSVIITQLVSCFMTPIAYQTNLIVQGMAGCRFADFLPLGAVLVVATTALTAILTPMSSRCADGPTGERSGRPAQP